MTGKFPEQREEENLKVIHGYFEELWELHYEVIRESYLKSRKETRVLFEILNNWIDATALFKEYELRNIVRSVSGVIFIYLWRAGNWILYEILTGHYFEAIRDIRFLFEGSLLALHYDYFIDKKVYNKLKALPTFDLKAEIVELIEALREKVRWLKGKRGKISPEDLKSLVRRHVEMFIAKAKLANEEREKYIELYCEVLAQPELYWSIPKIIDEYMKAWNLRKYGKILKSVWSRLSAYTHFSREFFNLALRRPEEIWIEHYDEELLKESCKLYIIVIDLLISTLVITFPKIRNVIKERIVKWWRENLGLKLEITEGILNMYT
mgnify:CR=1 FL=1